MARRHNIYSRRTYIFIIFVNIYIIITEISINFINGLIGCLLDDH